MEVSTANSEQSSSWLTSSIMQSMKALLILVALVVIGCARQEPSFLRDGADSVIAGSSEYPVAVDATKVGTYPAQTKSGAGYFYDDVLEYRVWLDPQRGAPRKNAGSDYFVSFAQYERALEFSKKSTGAEAPLVLVRQLKHVNEPSPGVFEVVDGERLTEWQVPWLKGTKREPGAIERFLLEHKK